MPKTLSLTLDGAELQGNTIINVAGLNGKDLPVGEFITFAGHSKVYIVVDSGIDGVGVTISPPLLSNIPHNAIISYGDKVTMRGKYDTDTLLGIQYTDGILANAGQIRIIEAL